MVVAHPRSVHIMEPTCYHRQIALKSESVRHLFSQMLADRVGGARLVVGLENDRHGFPGGDGGQFALNRGRVHLARGGEPDPLGMTGGVFQEMKSGQHVGVEDLGGLRSHQRCADQTGQMVHIAKLTERSEASRIGKVCFDHRARINYFIEVSIWLTSLEVIQDYDFGPLFD